MITAQPRPLNQPYSAFQSARASPKSASRSPVSSMPTETRISDSAMPMLARRSGPISKKIVCATGITRVRKIVCVQDCGLVLNLKTAETQCHGGIISGVNYALMEERILDRNTANMVNPNMEWYLIAGQSDMPEIDVLLMNQPERGVIGIGEPPAVATAAAIANAVRNATGVTVRSIPITPDKLLAELQKAGGTD